MNEVMVDTQKWIDACGPLLRLAFVKSGIILKNPMTATEHVHACGEIFKFKREYDQSGSYAMAMMLDSVRENTGELFGYEWEAFYNDCFDADAY